MRVLKFGGTSVGSPDRLRKLMEIIDPLQPQVVVLSAVSGTTNELVEIANALYEKKHEEANTLIDALESKYVNFLAQLFPSSVYLKKSSMLIIEHFNAIRAFTQDLFTVYEERIILSKGELISTALFSYYLEQIGIKNVLLPALDFMRLDEHSEPNIPYTTEHLTPLLAAHPNINIFITQGYICRNHFGEVDNLKRGGSDYTASLIGAAIGAEEVQIWTDIDGMHNNDPRIVSGTKPIRNLSFNEAAELAYFGAKILHPQSVFPAQKYNIPVRLLNTMEPKAPGTLISSMESEAGIKSIAAKDGITALKIQSSRMLLAYGFLRRVFEVFERYKTPIDMITTSEVAVSLTIDDNQYLAEIINELNGFGTVEIDADQSIICIVGDFLASKSGYAAKVMDSLKKIPIRMISYGGSSNNISVLVNTSVKNDALKALHKGLFE
ncbi:MAG: aspartate kinase [Sphingobacteriales bacterium]|nr:aspartate kinase [Sphingobacteriales bacterium]